MKKSKRNELEWDYTGTSCENGCRFAYQHKIYSSTKIENGVQCRFNNLSNINKIIMAVLGIILLIPILQLQIIFPFFLFISLMLFVPAVTMKHSAKQWHSAEHKVLAAFRKHKRMPNLAECANASPISKFCGSSSNLSIAFLLISIGALCDFSRSGNWVGCVIMAIIMFFALISIKYDWLIFIQRLVLSEPTEQQLQTALIAFGELLDAIEAEKLNSNTSPCVAVANL